MDVPRSADQHPPLRKNTQKKTPAREGLFAKLSAFFQQQKENDGEILDLVSAREESDSPLSIADKTLITAALEFSRQTADELSIPRADIVTLRVNNTYDEAIATFTACEHSRLPVIREDLDDIIGFVTLKDLVRHKQTNEPLNLKSLVRPCTFVPANLSVMKVLEALRHDKVQLAIVVDEYGGTSGLITLKDIIESLVGEMADEHDAESPQLLQLISPQVYHIDPRLPIEELEDALQTTFPMFDSSGNSTPREFETVGGLVLSLAGHVPTEGEKFSPDGQNTFTVLEADGRRIKKIKLQTTPHHAFE